MNALVTKAEATQKRANLADRLVNGLSSEGKRWKEDVDKLSEQMRRRGTFAPFDGIPKSEHLFAHDHYSRMLSLTLFANACACVTQ